MRRPTLVALVAAAAVAGAGPGVRATAQRVELATRVNRVLVDVDVRRGGQLASGLSAEDFEVLDDGDRQVVELVSASSVPVSVILALDTSTSLDAKQRAHFVRAGTRLIDELRPGESAALMTFSDRITIRSAFTTDFVSLRELVAAPAPPGDTALLDAAHVAMVLGTSAPGRPLVILLSDGVDTASSLSADEVLDTAMRTGAVVSVVKIGKESDFLKELTRVTGGVLVNEQSLDRVAERFAQLLDSFRSRYLLSFAPIRRHGPGWHRLSVRVRGGGDVQARTGYWSGP